MYFLRYILCTILYIVIFLFLYILIVSLTIKWYAFEEDIIYISKFVWDKDKVIEETLNIETDDFDKWYDKNIFNGNTYDDIDDSDDAIWYYDYDSKKEWIIWECDDLIKRYKDDYPAGEYYEWYKEISK